MNRHQRIGRGLFLIGIAPLIILAACAPRHHLVVNYELAEASEVLAGQQVRIEVKDLRDDPLIFTPEAAKQFPDFKSRYDLAWVNRDKQRIPVGEEDLQGLFKEAFKKRLALLGATIVPDTMDEAPRFQILINTLKIDLADRKWIARASFEANLFVDNQLVAREKVRGEAERVRILGSKGADVTLSEIFSEIINQLHIVKLYEQARIIE